VEQVFESRARRRRRVHASACRGIDSLVRECIELARVRHHLQRPISNIASFHPCLCGGGGACVLGDAEELRSAVSNLLDNA